MAKFSYLPENKRYTIIHLKDGGYSMRQIAAKVPCDLSTVVRTLKRFSETNFIADRRRSGHDQDKHIYVKTELGRSNGDNFTTQFGRFVKSKNQEINRLQLAVKLPWAIFFESVVEFGVSFSYMFSHSKIRTK
ncbi:hypothetical protein TNCV_2938711 [Trichonephila clavipes]|nr:hypothetical protein TNCV_2938711 [Trichonephila clavipes]